MANSGVLATGDASTEEGPVQPVNSDSLAPLSALCTIARFHQIAADPATLAHQLGLSSSDQLTISDVLRAAHHRGLKATLTATGWIAAGEAIMVRDLNGNGVIDSGRELFGDNTILTHGANASQTAANGFAALADLDADANGVSDGKFDANDVAFSSVQLWQDSNQDGVSQAGELHTFAELGVASINVAGNASEVNLGGGNTQTFSGSFTRADGQVVASGTAQLAGSLLLANNNFYRQFTDDPAITAAAQALPECLRTKTRHASCSRIAGHKWLGTRMDASWAFGSELLTAGEVTSLGVDEFALQVLHFRVDVTSKNHEHKTL